MIKSFLKYAVIVLAIAIAFNFNLVVYSLKQLKGQLQIVLNAEPVEDVIKSSNTPDSIKTKLLLITQVRKFGIEQLGLTNTKNYTTYYNQNGKPSLWVVTAAKPFALEEYQWHFPFLGKVPYKGFFSLKEAHKERDKITSLGYDVDIGTVGGWSTLGFFTDPVLSNVLKRSEGQIAELILHEMAHATIYFSDSTQFNENIATFIGEKGAELFLQHHFSSNNVPLINYLSYLADEKTYGLYMLQACSRLDSLYSTFNDTMSVYNKTLAKYRLIAQIMLEVKNLPLKNYKRYQWDFKDKKLPGNTHFLDYKRYRSTQQTFEVIYTVKAGSDFKKFVGFFKN